MHWDTVGIMAVPLIGVAGAYLKQHAEFATLKAQMAALIKEFKPNGGSSIKDDLNKLKTGQDIMNVRLDDHLKQHAGVWR